MDSIGQDIDGTANGDHFGWDVSMNNDGSIFAASSPYHSGTGQGSAGHVRVFKNTNGLWSQLGNDIYGQNDFDLSGCDISINGDGYTIAIGANQNDAGGNSSGHTRIFNYDGNSWVQIGQDIIGEESEDESGFVYQ